jgi:hypothetical protein
VSAYAVPLALTVLAAAVTWFTCMRPMRRGRGCGMARAGAAESSAERDRAAELAELRAKVEILQQHNPALGATGLPGRDRPASHRE